MKKILLAIIILVCAFSVGYFFKGYAPHKDNGEVFLSKSTGEYVGSFYEGNYVWSGAMNLAWTDLGEDIIGEKPQLRTDDKVVQRMVSILNNASFSKNDLDGDSYYIKSGYGQDTVDLINRESRLKFPTKSFEDLSMKILPQDIIAYAYFLKDVEYLEEFKETTADFKGDDVRGFYASEWEQKESIQIIKYWNDNKFIIALQLKDKEDQLLLAKGFDTDSPQSIADMLRTYDSKDYSSMKSDDLFKMPKLHLDLRRDYKELTGYYLANTGFTGYQIGVMYENIKFDMDQKGARVENEGVISARATASGHKPKKVKIRKFYLDKPFWVIMKQTDSDNPYFMLGVNNTEVMEKVLVD